MTTVTVVRKDGRISEVTVKGHSGYAKHGKDIVCAAVSAITQTALMGLIRFSSTKPEYTVEEATGYLHFTVPRGSQEEELRTDSVMETMLLGLQDVEKGYGSYVKVEVK